MSWRLVFATARGDKFVGEYEADIETMTRYIGKAGLLEARIPLPNDEVGASVQPILKAAGKHTVYVYRDNKIWWGGKVESARVVGNETATMMEVEGATFEAYPDQREARVDAKFVNLEQTEYIRHLWNYMQSTTGGDLGIETDFPAMSTRTRSYKWLRSDARKIADIMGEIAGNIDGFEWAIDCFDDGGRRRRVLNVGYPQIKRPSLPLVLSFPGNIIAYEVDTDATQGALAFQARGMSEKQAADLEDAPEEWGKWAPIDRTIPSWIDEKTWQEWADLLDAKDKEDQPLMSAEHFATDLLNEGYVRTDATIQRQDTGSIAGLNAWARKGVQMRGGPLVLPSIMTFLDDFQTAQLGSYAKLRITDTPYPAKANGAPGYEGSARCIGYEISPGTFGSPDTVKVVFEDPFSRSMQTQARQRKTLTDTISELNSTVNEIKADSAYNNSYYSGGGGGDNPGNGSGGSAGKIGTIANPWGGPKAAKVILNGSTEPDELTYNYLDNYAPAAGDRVLLGDFAGEMFILGRIDGSPRGWMSVDQVITAALQGAEKPSAFSANGRMFSLELGPLTDFGNYLGYGPRWNKGFGWNPISFGGPDYINFGDMPKVVPSIFPYPTGGNDQYGGDIGTVSAILRSGVIDDQGQIKDYQFGGDKKDWSWTATGLYRDEFIKLAQHPFFSPPLPRLVDGKFYDYRLWQVKLEINNDNMFAIGDTLYLPVTTQCVWMAPGSQGAAYRTQTAVRFMRITADSTGQSYFQVAPKAIIPSDVKPYYMGVRQYGDPQEIADYTGSYAELVARKPVVDGNRVIINTTEDFQVLEFDPDARDTRGPAVHIAYEETLMEPRYKSDAYWSMRPFIADSTNVRGGKSLWCGAYGTFFELELDEYLVPAGTPWHIHDVANPLLASNNWYIVCAHKGRLVLAQNNGAFGDFYYLGGGTVNIIETRAKAFPEDELYQQRINGSASIWVAFEIRPAFSFGDRIISVPLGPETKIDSWRLLPPPPGVVV